MHVCKKNGTIWNYVANAGKKQAEKTNHDRATVGSISVLPLINGLWSKKSKIQKKSKKISGWGKYPNIIPPLKVVPKLKLPNKAWRKFWPHWKCMQNTPILKRLPHAGNNKRQKLTPSRMVKKVEKQPKTGQKLDSRTETAGKVLNGFSEKSTTRALEG